MARCRPWRLFSDSDVTRNSHASLWWRGSYASRASACRAGKRLVTTGKATVFRVEKKETR